MPAHALFALGIYLSNPDSTNPQNEAAYEANYASFVSAMNVTPEYIDTYVDGTQPISNWPNNADFQASSIAQSPDASFLTPVVGLSLNSTVGGAPDSEAQFKSFARGDNDAVVQGVVDNFAKYGFKKVVFRLGLEMNIGGPNYAGDDGSTSQTHWLAAFRHVATVLRREAKADNIKVQICWNPDTSNYTNATATNLYPGDQYVDIIGVDMYADMWPYQDGYNSGLYHDWDTGGEDTSQAQFFADPINREHYWTYPAGCQRDTDCSGGHAESFETLLQFAEQHNKPFAVPEAGAGNVEANADINDDAAFPLWLSQELTTAQATGLKIAFVTIWDSQGAGNYEFSRTSDNKPGEAASWAKYFGPQPDVVLSSHTPALQVGTGPDTVQLRVSEDAWGGDAQYTVAVDGTQVGGTLTASANHATGQNQLVGLHGTWGSGSHTVTVTYLNDANDGTVETDRNLYVVGANYNGTVAPAHSLVFFGGGPQSLALKSSGAK